MRDLVSFVSEKIADAFAHITDDNEMFYENIDNKNSSFPNYKGSADEEKAKQKRIEDIKVYIAALQDELKHLEGAEKEETLGDVEMKAKRSAAAKKAAATRKKNREYWAEYNAGGCGGNSSRSSGGCGSSGRSSRSYRSYGGCGGGWSSSSSC